MVRYFNLTLVGLFFCLAPPSATQASDDESPQTAGLPAAEAPPLANDHVEPEKKTYQVIRPCLGSGYVPYTYSAIDSCPCGSDGCFHPHKYYFGGKSYRMRWLHRWLRAKCPHSSHSMLEDYPCECIFPKYGRPYWRVLEAATGASGQTELDVEAQ